MKATRQKTVLVVSRDSRLADVRKQVLEEAGFNVVSVSALNDVAAACKHNKIDMALIGYSLPPAERRRVFVELRKYCNCPVLELFNESAAELVDELRTYSHKAKTPDDFLAAVKAIFNESMQF